MPAIESVEITGDRRSHWRAKLPGGIPTQWDSEVIEDQPNSFIAWRTLPDSHFRMNGNVRFDRAPGGRGTIVRTEIQLAIPAGPLVVKAAKPLGADPGEQLAKSLRKFKQIMETGEVTHSDASIHPGKHAAQPPSEPARELVAH